MMQQLPLHVGLRASSVFASFLPGPNAEVVTQLQARVRQGRNPSIFLYGPHASGKSHLLQALCAAAGQRNERAAYMPLRELEHYGPSLLEGGAGMQLICIDDVSAVTHQRDWATALFELYHHLEECGGVLVLADEASPQSLQFALPDLASRVLAGNVLRLRLLDDDEQLAALRLQAAQRGMELPEEVGAFLLKRLPRDMAALSQFIDVLDHASLAAQRKLTLPFVRDVLERHASI